MDGLRRAVDAKLVSQIRAPRRSTGVSTAGDAVGTIREAGLADAPFDFEDLFRAQYGRVTSVVSRVVRNPARAEELAVDAFLKLWRTPGAHGPGASAWVLRTALRLDRRVASCDPAGALRAAPEARQGTRRPRRTAPRPEKNAGACFASSPPFDASTPRCCCSAATASPTTSWRRRSASGSTSVGTLLRRARQAFRKEYVQTPWPDMTIPTSTAGWIRVWQPWIGPERASRRPTGRWRY